MFEQSFTLLFQAVERIRQKLQQADAQHRDVLGEELNRLHQTSASYFDHWIRLDEQIRNVAEDYSLSLFCDPETFSAAHTSHHSSFEQSTETPDVPLDASALLSAPLGARTGKEWTLSSRTNVEASSVSIEDVAFDLTDKSAFALRKGLAFYELLMFQEATTALTEVVDTWDQPVARLYLAASHAALGHFLHAQHHLQEVKSKTQTAKILCACSEIEAYIAIEQGDMEAAVRCFSEVIHALPTYTDAWYNLAMCSLSQGDYQCAERCLRHFNRQCPDDLEGLEWLAFALYRQGEFTEVGEMCRTALKNSSTHFHILWLYCASCRKLCDYEVGSQLSRRMVISNPLHPQGYLHSAWFALKAGDIHTSVTILKQVLTLHPNHPEALLQLGISEFLQNDFQRAEKTLLQAISTTQNKSLAWIALGRISAKQGDYRQAERRLFRAVRDKRTSIQSLALTYVAITLEERGKGEEAIHYRRAVAQLEAAAQHHD